MRAVLALPLLLCLGAIEPTFHYHLDARASEVSARVSFFGLASKTAQFPKMKGTITLQPGRLDTIDLDVELDATALTAGDRLTTGRLKGPDFFDVAHFPVVRFAGQRMTMTGPVTAQVVGTITARGQTHPAMMDVAFQDPPARTSGHVPVQLSARATIDRRDFGMTAYSMIVGKKVTITVNTRMVPG